MSAAQKPEPGTAMATTSTSDARSRRSTSTSSTRTKRATQLVAQIRGTIWGREVNDTMARAVAQYCRENQLDAVRHVEVLGGRIYLTAEFYDERGAELLRSGVIVPQEPDYINADARLDELAKMGDSWACAEELRRKRERIRWSVPEDAKAAVVQRFIIAENGKAVDRRQLVRPENGKNELREDSARPRRDPLSPRRRHRSGSGAAAARRSTRSSPTRSRSTACCSRSRCGRIPRVADRWMIVDGERRYRGALAAKVKTIPAQITLEVEDVGDRLVRQIVRNEGKPLTPVEEAKAFKRIIDERRAAGQKTYGVVQLAKELGHREVDGERSARAHGHPRVLARADGHGPAAALARAAPPQVGQGPEKYQLKALEQMKADYRWPGGEDTQQGEEGRAHLRRRSRDAAPHVHDEVHQAGERGARLRRPDRARGFRRLRRPKTYAMDPSKWQPIHRKQIAAKRSKTVADVKSGKKEPATPRWVTAADRCRREARERLVAGLGPQEG
jgi:hypothetical protein